jgi:hypothetical protein
MMDQTEAPTDNPISKLRGLWHKATSKAKKDAIELPVWRHHIQVFVAGLISDKGGCFDIHKAPNGRIGCDCMTHVVLDDEDKVAVVDYLMAFAQMTKTQQESLLVEWMRYAKLSPGKGSLCFILPGSTTHKICKHACAKVIGYGERSWRRVNYFLEKNIQPSHGLTGKTGNRALTTIDKVQLVTFFNDMLELGCPRATLVVRNFTPDGGTSTELREDDADLIELPACYSKRHLWRRFLQDNGWQVKIDNVGRIIEKIRIPGEQQTIKECLSWTAFNQFWEDHFPKVVIQRAREDICDDCFVFANQHRYGKRPKNECDLSDLVSEVNLDDEAAVMEASELRVLAAAKHVERARKQRELFNVKKQQAKDDKDKPRKDRVYCFVADFAQNMNLPNFAEEQPGATYYYSPMSVYPFGIVDCSTSPSELTAYCYYEGKYCCLAVCSPFFCFF